jgi:hypothetical protein
VKKITAKSAKKEHVFAFLGVLAVDFFWLESVSNRGA